MNVVELHELFRLRLDRMDGSYLPDVLSEEIDSFLNLAQLQIIKTKYGQNNTYQKGFQENQKRTDDLNSVTATFYLFPENSSNLLKEEEIKFDLTKLYNPSPTATTYQVSQFVQSNKQYMIFLRAEARTKADNCDYKWQKVSIVQIDDVNHLLRDPHNSPSSEYPAAYFVENSMMMPIKGFDVEVLKITCIFIPQRISLADEITTILPEMIQDELVERAITLALESLGHPRIQTQPSIKTQNE